MPIFFPSLKKHQDGNNALLIFVRNEEYFINHHITYELISCYMVFLVPP